MKEVTDKQIEFQKNDSELDQLVELESTKKEDECHLVPDDNNSSFNSNLKFSWKSFLLGGPIYESDCNASENSDDAQKKENDYYVPPKEVIINAKDSLKNASNWIWNSASYILQTDESNNQNLDPQKQTSIQESKSDNTTLEQKSWFSESLWSNMKSDFQELAQSFQNDTQYLLNKTKANVAISKIAEKTSSATWVKKASEATFNYFSSFILNEDDILFDDQEKSDSLAQMESINCYSDRVKKQLAILLSGPSPIIFEKAPQPLSEYEGWLESLESVHSDRPNQNQSAMKYHLELHSPEIGQLLLDHEAVRREYARLVINKSSNSDESSSTSETDQPLLMHDDFFLRYLFHKERLEASDRRREQLKALANSGSTEMSLLGGFTNPNCTSQSMSNNWGDSDDEEEESKGTLIGNATLEVSDKHTEDSKYNFEQCSTESKESGELLDVNSEQFSLESSSNNTDDLELVDVTKIPSNQDVQKISPESVKRELKADDKPSENAEWDDIWD